MVEPSVAALHGADLLAAVAHHLDEGDFVQAIDIAERQFAGGTSIKAVCALSAIAFRQGNLAGAIKMLEPVADGVQGNSDVPEALAVLNCLAGRVSEALYYGKLATVLQPDNTVLPLFGSKFPKYADAFLAIEHKPLLSRARAAFDNGSYLQARGYIEQHLELFRDDVEALDRYAECLIAMGEYRRAVGVLRSVLTLGGPSATLYSRLGQSLVALGDFDQGMACHRQAVTRGNKAAVLWAAMVRDWAYSPWGENAARSDAVAGLVKTITEAGPKIARKPPAALAKPVLTIGFLCNAPADQDQRAMTAAIARGFDRASVRVIGFGPGELGEAVNLPYRGGFTAWRNTNKVDELTLSAVIRGESLDVLIDADGLAARERLSLMTRNAAPRQFSWLNVPVGVQIPGINMHLGAESGPSCGMFLLSCAEGSPTPLPAGLAEGRVTLGADVTLAELNPELVRTWSAILHAIPEATLALLDHGFSEPDATNRLVEMFGNFGVAHRIDVLACGRAEEFFANVDIALAPFPIVRPDPYGVALSAGVPVVALAGRDATGFSRTLERLDQIVGSQTVVADVGQYVGKVISLAADLGALAEFRKTVPLQIRQSVVFSPQAFAGEWERFFRESLSAEG